MHIARYIEEQKRLEPKHWWDRTSSFYLRAISLVGMSGILVAGWLTYQWHFPTPELLEILSTTGSFLPCLITHVMSAIFVVMAAFSAVLFSASFQDKNGRTMNISHKEFIFMALIVAAVSTPLWVIAKDIQETGDHLHQETMRLQERLGH